jgi:hypothetical protein
MGAKIIYDYAVLYELHNFHTSPNIIRVIKLRRMGWVWHVAQMGDMRHIYKILVRKPEGKRPLGRIRYRREDVRWNQDRD